MFSTMPIKSQKYGIEALQGINAKYLHLYKESIAERKRKDILNKPGGYISRSTSEQLAI